MSSILGSAVLILFLIVIVSLGPRCSHFNVRCVHGDEINMRNGARMACVDCGRSLHDRPMVCIHNQRSISPQPQWDVYVATPVPEVYR